MLRSEEFLRAGSELAHPVLMPTVLYGASGNVAAQNAGAAE